MIARRRTLGAAGALALIAAFGSAGPAWAAPTTQVVQGDVIRLVSVADWEAASSLLPGEPVRWDVAVSARAPDPGTVSLAVSARGDAPLTLDVALCMTAWQESGCPGGATQLRSAWSIPRDGAEIAIAEFPDTEVAHLRLAIRLAPTAAPTAADGEATDIRVHARGAGESVIVGPEGALATTGLPPVAPWMLGAGGLLAVVGAMLVLSRRRRHDEHAGEGA